MPESRHGGGGGATSDAQQEERARADGAASARAPQSTTSGPDPLIGKNINGRFRIVSVLARGGMGKVYKAEQAPLGRLCALKVLSPKYDGDRDPEFHKRFFLEASTAAKLTHANTVTIFDYGKADDEELYYIAMELIEGRTLHKVLREEGPFGDERARHIAAQVCRSLREAHSMGVVHRDLKPGNIMLTDKGDERDNVKVLDFGLVKDVTGEAEDLTQAGLFMGSPKYMAPEQILGHEVSAATDIYSLGIMIFEMIVGKVPFDRGASVGTLMAHVNDAVPEILVANPNARVSPATEAIVRRCLEKDPAKRFATMKDVLHALKRAAGGDSVTDTFEGLPAASARVERPPLTPIPPSSSISSSSLVGVAPHIDNTQITVVPSLSPSGASSSPDSSLFSHARTRPKSKAYLWAILVSCAAAAAIVVAMSKRQLVSGDEPQPSASAAVVMPSAIPSAAPSAQPVESAAAPKGPRTVHVVSEPAGASVSEAGTELCPSTPCDLVFKNDADHKLAVTKKGFKAAKVTATLKDDKLDVKLDPVAISGPYRRPQQQEDSGGSYKPDPYK